MAVAEGGVRGEVREYGRIANTPTALRRLAGKLCPQGVELRFCYEAGPCGYGIQRQLSTTMACEGRRYKAECPRGTGYCRISRFLRSWPAALDPSAVVPLCSQKVGPCPNADIQLISEFA